MTRRRGTTSLDSSLFLLRASKQVRIMHGKDEEHVPETTYLLATFRSTLNIIHVGKLWIDSVPRCLNAYSDKYTFSPQDIVTYICSLEMEQISLLPPSLSTSAFQSSHEDIELDDGDGQSNTL